MAKDTVIIHSVDDDQSGFVRMFYPTFIANTKTFNYGINVERRSIIASDHELKNYVQSVVIQRPVQKDILNLCYAYAAKRSSMQFNLVYEFDDVLWEVNQEWKDNLKKIAELPNFVVCSTRNLANEWKKISSRPAIVMPNGVAGYTVSIIHDEISSDIEKPVILYGGASGHDDDFGKNWSDYLHEAVKNDEIELHSFVDVPGCEDVKDKIKYHNFTTPIEWLNIISEIKPDFYIAPLEENILNKCKSDLKVKEVGAMGCVFIGSDFPGSPYSYVPSDMLVGKSSDVKAVVKNLCKKDVYNKNRNWLRSRYISNGWDIMSDSFMRRWINAYANGRV